MAQRVEVILVDDLNGEPADETVQFSLDGAAFEIDLTAENASTLREAMHPFVQAGRKVRPVRKRRAPKP